MSKITKQDWYQVLKHWEDNVVLSGGGESYRRDAEVCAFCKKCHLCMVITRNPEDGLPTISKNKCPISDDTGKIYCYGTPWCYTFTMLPEPTWEEFLYLLNLAYANDMADEYMDEIEVKNEP